MTPSHQVLGYLCSDLTCSTIHPFRIQTGNSSIAKTRTIVSEYIETNYSKSDDEYLRALLDAELDEMRAYTHCTSDGMFEALGDSLSSDELRAVVEILIKFRLEEEGARAELSRQLNTLVRDPAELVKQFDDASLLQVSMLSRDEEVVRAIDFAVDSGRIDLGSYEVRSRKLSRWGDPVRAEIGALGLRFASPRQGFISDRLSRVLHQLFFEEADGLNPADLAYALELPDSADEATILDHATGQLVPEDMLGRLVNGGRTIGTALCRVLDVYSTDVSRAELVERLTWKLGVPIAFSFNDLQQLAEYENQLDGAILTGGVSETVLRGIGSNLFTKLEDALQRAITFSTWALTVDHFVSDDGFVYDPLIDWEPMGFLRTNAPTTDSQLELKTDGRNTLGPLGSAFSRLAKALKLLKAEEKQRPFDQYPVECRTTSRDFFMQSTVPFLSLSEVSRSDVLDGLQEVSRSIQDATVLGVRNSIMHGNTAFPSIREIAVAVEKIGRCRRTLSQIGLYPRVYRLVSRLSDYGGKTSFRYESDDLRQEIIGPNWALTPKLPIGNSQLLIMPKANLGSAGPLRFGLKLRPGPDPYWKGWPTRQKKEAHLYNASDRLGGAPGIDESLTA